MGLVNKGSEPFSFPPDLSDLATYNGPSLENLIPAIGISHNQISFAGWTDDRACNFNCTVFLTKLRDKF